MIKFTGKNKRLFLVSAITLLLLFILPPYMTGYMFGKEYITDRDYSCCKDDQLITYHYYEFHTFWIVTNSGYKTESRKLLSKLGCNVRCND